MRIRGAFLVLCLLMVAAATDAGEVVGWRTDWTGRYPDAEPPLQWSDTEHVVWKTPMPGPGNASPVLVGDRILVCSEPTTLLCVRAGDGKILWERTNTYLDALPAERAERVRRLMDKVRIDETTRKLRDLENRHSRARSKLRRHPDDAALKKEKAELEEQIAAVEKRLEPVADFVMPECRSTNGYASPTPVSDGEHVWVLFGTGVAGCYDLEGNRRWVRLVERPTHQYGHSASPLLAGDKLILHVRSVFAMEKRTGKTLWRSDAKSAWGTSLAAEVGGERAVITPNGDVFRATDGERIARLRARLAYNQPLVEEGVVYFIEHGGKAFRLPKAPGEEPVELWQTQPRKDRYYASPVLHDGLLYAVTQHGHLSAIDAATGEGAYEEKLDLGRHQCYPSLTLAGGSLYVSGSDGITVVFRPGRTFEPVARNTLEPFRTSPVFRGKRMFVRGLKHLYCIGE